MRGFKFVLTSVVVCACSLNMQGQSVQTPTMDLYDTGMMNMYLQSARETAARRYENYIHYGDLAVEACAKKQWSGTIYYVNEALGTGYYNGILYYFRGMAYENIGNISAAEKDYKMAKKLGCVEASGALVALKAKMKSRK